jgi:hypothetical protein
MQGRWEITPEKKFKFFLKQIAQDGHNPDYDIAIDDRAVTFRQS